MRDREHTGIKRQIVAPLNSRQLLLRPDVVRRAAKTSLLVGTVLVVINQGDVLLRGVIDAAVASKILLTYCVPYAVSSFSSAAALSKQSREHAGQSAGASQSE